MTQRKTSFLLCADITESVAVKLQNTQSLCRTIQRARIRENAPPPNPATAEDLIISGDYANTQTGAKFLYYDNKKKNRIIIFTTRKNLKFLQNCKHWHADGTFKTVPNIFAHLYTIHGLYENTTIPLVYNQKN